MASRNEMEGKVVIITGASAGIGEAIAYTMSSEGAKVALCGRNQENLDKVKQKCASIQKNSSDENNDNFLTIQGDLTSSEHRKEIVSKTVDKFGKIDVLIPNAGVVYPLQNLETASEEMYDKIMDINLKSVFFLIQAAVPHLKETKGSIVCISSLYSAVPTPTSQVYAISKAAMDYMVKSFCRSLGPYGIRINSVNPSFVFTSLLRNFPNSDAAAEAFAKKEIPLHQLEGTRCCTGEEVAQTVLFLASSRSSFTTGGIYFVDGGRRYSTPN